MAIDGQVLLSHTAFCQPCETELVHYKACRPTGSTNQNWLVTKLLPMAVSIYAVVCVHSCRLLRAQYHCLWPNGREGPPLACAPTPITRPPPPTHLPLINVIRDITGVVKKLSQKPAVNNAQQS